MAGFSRRGGSGSFWVAADLPRAQVGLVLRITPCSCREGSCCQRRVKQLGGRCFVPRTAFGAPTTSPLSTTPHTLLLAM